MYVDRHLSSVLVAMRAQSCLGLDRMQLPADVAAQLGMSAKATSVLRRENASYADDDPVNHVATCIRWDIAKGTGPLQDECRISSVSTAFSKNSITR